jgi:hypothetical protein
MFYGKIVYLQLTNGLIPIEKFQLTNGLIPIEKLKRLIEESNVPYRYLKKMIRQIELFQRED